MPTPLPAQALPTLRTRLYPAYYASFHCLADCCRDDCCQGWKITFSKKDYLALKRARKSPELEAATTKALRRLRGENTYGFYAEFATHEGHCPFFNERGLCSLQLECGEGVLPDVCRTFPRKRLYTYSERADSLSPACEGVLQLLWDLPDGIDFVEEDLPRKDWRERPRQPQSMLFPLLRERCIDILQARQFSLERRLLLLGLALEPIGREGWELDAAAWARRVDLLLSDPTLSQDLERLSANRGGFLVDRMRLILRLVAQQPFFGRVRDFFQGEASRQEDEQTIHCDPEIYERAAQALKEGLGDLEPFFENLLVSVFFYLGYPRMGQPEDVWRSYVNLCNLWGLYRFAAVAGYGLEPTRAGLFRALVMASRCSLHNDQRMGELREELFDNNSATLAHMAVLIQG